MGAGRKDGKRGVAALFGESIASVVKWSQRLRDTGSASSRPMGGHRKRLLDPHRELVLERLKAMPDLTLKAMVAELTERGYRVSPNTVWSLLRKAGHSFKKKPVRRGAGSPEDRTAAGAVEAVSGTA